MGRYHRPKAESEKEGASVTPPQPRQERSTPEAGFEKGGFRGPFTIVEAVSRNNGKNVQGTTKADFVIFDADGRVAIIYEVNTGRLGASKRNDKTPFAGAIPGLFTDHTDKKGDNW